MVTTGANGTATFTVSGNGQAGLATVTASMPNQGVSSSLPATISFATQSNPQLVGNVPANVYVSSVTPFTVQFHNAQWGLLANTTVYAQVTGANTGGLSVNGSTPAQSVTATTDANGQVTMSYTAASQITNGITITFYSDAAMQNAYSYTIPFTVVQQGPTLTAKAVSPTEIDLSWTAVTNAVAYQVQRSPDGVNWTTLTPPNGIAALAYNDVGNGINPPVANYTYSYQAAPFYPARVNIVRLSKR